MRDAETDTPVQRGTVPPQAEAVRSNGGEMTKEQIRERMPGCVAIVQAFAVFSPRVMEMEEGGTIWRRS